MLFSLVGCGKATTDISDSIKMDTNSDFVDSYPVDIDTPTSVINSYPLAIEDNTPTHPSPPMTIPNPDPQNGIVVGTLISKTTLEPMPFFTIYMADKVPLEPGPGYVISFQEKSSPKTITNERGEFILENIQPDEHIPLMVTPFGTFPLLDSDFNQIEIEITKGFVYDLGEIFVNWP